MFSKIKSKFMIFKCIIFSCKTIWIIIWNFIFMIGYFKNISSPIYVSELSIQSKYDVAPHQQNHHKNTQGAKTNNFKC